MTKQEREKLEAILARLKSRRPRENEGEVTRRVIEKMLATDSTILGPELVRIVREEG